MKMARVVAICLVGAVASLTHASLVTVNFAGYVNAGENPAVPLNTPVTGHWTYDDTLTGSVGTGWDMLSGARFGPMEVSMQFGDVQSSTLSSNNAVLHLGFLTWGGGTGVAIVTALRRRRTLYPQQGLGSQIPRQRPEENAVHFLKRSGGLEPHPAIDGLREGRRVDGNPVQPRLSHATFRDGSLEQSLADPHPRGRHRGPPLH